MNEKRFWKNGEWLKINDIIKISHVYKIEVHGKDVLWINDNNIID